MDNAFELDVFFFDFEAGFFVGFPDGCLKIVFFGVDFAADAVELAGVDGGVGAPLLEEVVVLVVEEVSDGELGEWGHILGGC